MYYGLFSGENIIQRPRLFFHYAWDDISNFSNIRAAMMLPETACQVLRAKPPITRSEGKTFNSNGLESWEQGLLFGKVSGHNRNKHSNINTHSNSNAASEVDAD